MLDLTLTLNRATSKLLLKHQSRYKWITCRGVCVFQWGAYGSIYSVPKAIPQHGSNIFVTKDGRVATTWSTGHDS
jgi:hypothetical protein